MRQLDIETIQKDHQELIHLNLETGELDIDLEQVQKFIGTLAQAGVDIEDVEQRSFLRTLIRYWACILYEKTDIFPAVQLQDFNPSKTQLSTSQNTYVIPGKKASPPTSDDAPTREKRSVSRPILLMLIILALLIIVLVFVVIFYPQPELILGLMLALAINILVILLFIMAAGFAALNMSNNQQALGLPPGSIRAVIALCLIVVWSVSNIFLFNVAESQSTNSVIVGLLQQFSTTIGTLVIATIGFYFGSRNQGNGI